METRSPSEEVRYAAHIFQKWGEVMAKKLAELRLETLKFGCETPRQLTLSDLDDLVEIRVDGPESLDSRVRLFVRGELLYPFQAFIHPFFDIEKIPEIRNVVVEAVKRAERILEEAIKVDREKQEKIKILMPSVIDELGADIMQYGGGPAKLPPHEDLERAADNVHQAFKVTTKNQQVTPIAPPPGVTPGGIGAAAAGIGVSPRQAWAVAARERLTKIEERLKAQSVAQILAAAEKKQNPNIHQP